MLGLAGWLTFDLCAEDHGVAGAEGFVCLERTY
jgi:hypothetical protein